MFPFGKAFILITLLAKYVTSEILTQPTRPSLNCHTDNGVYALNSTYHKNLNTVMSDLTDHSLNSLYYNSSSGGREDHEAAYAKYYCRGDISTQSCHDCVSSAASFVLDRAPCLGVRSGIVWYDECTLRYQNKSNVGVYDNPWNPSYTFQTPDESEETDFDPAVKGLTQRLIQKAAYGEDPRAFATGDVKVTGNKTRTVYCLVQCSPDIKGLLCEDCLTLALTGVANLTVNPTVLRWFYPQCQLRFDLDIFYQPSSPMSTGSGALQVTPTSPGDATSEKVVKSNVARIAVPVVVVSILLVCAASFAIWFCLSRRRIKNSSNIQKQTFRDAIPQDSGIGNVECFKFTAIEEATMKFSLHNKLAQGGFGTVYKGILINGQQIAIKRLSKYSSQGIKEFKTEVAVVAKLQHRNLVRLLGFCAEQEERILVYEFLSNLSLDRFLFDSTMSAKLDWKTRMKIIQGVAWGLRYLHVDSLLTVVHRDLKSSNILLDEEMNPKIADFGMAKLVKIDDTIGNTSRIAGTYGYMAPEYAMIGRFSTKSDIYSFGVIIVEVVSGKSVNHFHDADNGLGLLHQAWRNWNANAIETLVDPNLENSYSRNEVERCLQIGLLCVQGDAAKRPTIREVVSMLENPFLQLPSPSAPSSFFHSSDISTVATHSQGGQKTESSISS